MAGSRLLIAGIDGVSHSFIQELIRKGELPYLASLAEQGNLQPLASVEIPLTAIAWTTSYTGKNPGRLNVPGFVRQKKNSYLWEYVSPADRASQDFWKIASDQGLRSVLLGTIFCQNREDFQGVFVGGEYCGDIRHCVYPEELKDTIFERFKYQPSSAYGSAEEMKGYIENKFRVAAHLNDAYPWNFFFLSFMEPDIAHAMYHLSDLEVVVEAYRTIDRGLQAFTESLGEEVDVVLYSDHGNRPYPKALHVNSWLHAQGFLQLKTRGQTVRHHARQFWGNLRGVPAEWGLRKRIQYRLLYGARFLMKLFPRLHAFLLRHRRWLPEPRQSQPQVDPGRELQRTIEPGVLFEYSRTQAYAFLNHGGNFAGICINRRGRHPEGLVSDEDYEACREQLIQQLRSAVDPADGQPLIKQVWKREEVFWGTYAEDFPDIVFEAHDDYFTYISEDDVSPRKIAFTFPTCQHERQGFLLCSGERFRTGVQLPSRIVDIAPTLLYALGCTIPDDFDGEVIEGVFAPGYLIDHPICMARQATALDPQLARGYSLEEEKLIEQRLKDLGYFE